MKFERTARLAIIMAMVGTYFFVEIIVGYMLGALTLVSDAFHMLSDFIALGVGIYAIRIAKRMTTHKMTYGWARAEILGALVNTTFLIGLLFTVTVEAIHRFFKPEEIENPFWVIITGSVGCGINLIGIALLWGAGGHGHSHAGGGHGHSHGGGGGHEEAEGDDHGHGHSHKEKKKHGHGHDHKEKKEKKEKKHGHSHDDGGDHGHSHDNKEKKKHGHSHDGDGDHGHSHDGEGEHSHDHSHDGHSHSDDHSHENIANPKESTTINIPTTETIVIGGDEDGHSHENAKKATIHHEVGDVDVAITEKERRAQKMSNTNMRGVFLHVAGDFLGSIMVIIVGVISYTKPDFAGTRYIDPALSLVMVTIVLYGAIPLAIQTSYVLLQTVPVGVDSHGIKKELLQVNGIKYVHEMHIWQLTDNKYIASCHIICDPNVETDLMKISVQVKEIFHNNGIHATTVQPEFLYDPTSTSMDESEHCRLLCQKPSCSTKVCCSEPTMRKPRTSELDKI